MTTADRVAATSFVQAKSFLRGLKEHDAANDNEDRGLETLKQLPKNVFNSIFGPRKEMSSRYVKKLLRKPDLREKTFANWAKSDLDGTDLFEGITQPCQEEHEVSSQVARAV
ncbi:unnamed protein product [Phytophthora lilii]|uniref:RxLR effector protein n=1 Tax=Phytophthora lilii TaxID=2077276 RepID=A0A9W6WYX2_9STRA|nr:unnamed protein product [Phytophthora lilii]